MPSASMATIKTMASTACFQPPIFVLRKNRPKAIATNTYRIEIEAALAFGASCAPSAEKPLNVPATISAKAAMTSRVNSQANKKNRRRPLRPM